MKFILSLILLIPTISLAGEMRSGGGSAPYGVWHLNEGSGVIAYDGTGRSSASVAGAWIDGVLGKSVRLNGNPNVIAMKVNILQTNPVAFSYCFWVKDITTGAGQYWGPHGTKVSGEININMYMYKSGALYYPVFYMGRHAVSNDVTIGYSTHTTINAQWTHLAYSQTLTSASAFINGKKIGSVNYSYIGGTAKSWDYALGKQVTTFYTGTWDDVAIWDRALTDGEVHRIYLEGRGRHSNAR
jgi:hypothetical protein